MNIGLFTDCYLPTKNGVATAIAQTQQELEHRGHKVVVLTVASPKPPDVGACPGTQAATSVYRFPSLPFRSDIELRLGLPRQAAVDRIVAREQLDLIHTHTEFSLGWAGKRAARRAGLPLFHTLHTLYPFYRHYLPLGHLLTERAVNGLLARFVRGYDVVICPSEKGRAYMASVAPEARTAVIGNGVARARFDPARVAQDERCRARAALGVSPTERVILYVGRLAEEKRVSALLAALAPVLRADPLCRALFVGAGPERQKLPAAARAAGLGRQVLLTGPVAWERMAEIYAAADLFVTVSLSEIHPMTLIEAAMCGLPIVARRDAGLGELVLDGCNGFLVDSDAEIAGRVVAILHDNATWRACSEGARTRPEQATIEAHVDRLDALYRQVIEHRQREGREVSKL